MKTFKAITIDALFTGMTMIAVSTPILNMVDKESFWFIPSSLGFLIGGLITAIGLLMTLVCGARELCRD